MKWILWIAGGLVLHGRAGGRRGRHAARGAITARARRAIAWHPTHSMPCSPGRPTGAPASPASASCPSATAAGSGGRKTRTTRRSIYELVEAVPPERLVVRIASQGLPFSGAWTFLISPIAGGGSELRIDEDGEIYNVIFRFLARFFFGYTASIEGYLRDLGVKFDETVAIEP